MPSFTDMKSGRKDPYFLPDLGKSIFMEVSDKGKGILNVEEAMQPMYTTKPEEDRSGMGFAFMGSIYG